MKLNPNSDTKLRLESLSLSMIFIMMMWPGALLLAQEDDSEDQLVLEEVIVTATRRGELLQDIPISVSAITKQKIELEGIRTFEDYGVRVPNLSFSASSNSNATNSLNISIRGVAGGTTTGFYIDDTPLPQGLNPRVLDIERIEVLRGPQGTLFGARSMGGTVRMITSQPDPVAFSGVAHAAIGAITDGKTSYLGDVMLNIPFSDDHAMRLTAYAQKIGGFIDIEPADSSNNPYIAGDPSVPLLTETLKDTNGYDVKGFQLAGRFVFADQRLVITPRIMYEKPITTAGPRRMKPPLGILTEGSMAGYLICRNRLKTSGGWVRSPLATMRTSGISYRRRRGLTAIQPIPRMLPWLTRQAS
jgi:outer membrane receptor protein involved in Fe transport